MSTATAQPVKDRFLRIDEVMHRVGFRTTEVYKRMKAGTFPKGISLARRTVVWSECAVDKWIADQIANAQPPADGSV